jgi:hypothetical protein
MYALLRMNVHRKLRIPKPIPSPLPSTTFWRINELVTHTIGFMSLKDLATYSCLSVESREDVRTLFAVRVRCYVSPFVLDQWYSDFFSRLEEFKSLIVGSVALAALCVTSTPSSPTNLNIICPFHYRTPWLLFLVAEMAFLLDSEAACTGPYALAGATHISLHHEDRPVSSDDLSLLFFFFLFLLWY